MAKPAEAHQPNNETIPEKAEQVKHIDETAQDVHPMEKIDIKIKPGGPLPPVVINDTPKRVP